MPLLGGTKYFTQSGYIHKFHFSCFGFSFFVDFISFLECSLHVVGYVCVCLCASNFVLFSIVRILPWHRHRFRCYQFTFWYVFGNCLNRTISRHYCGIIVTLHYSGKMMGVWLKIRYCTRIQLHTNNIITMEKSKSRIFKSFAFSKYSE